MCLPELTESKLPSMPAMKKVSATTTKAMVQVLDPAGRIFEPGEDGVLHDSGCNVYDPNNKDETGGILGKLTSKNIIKHGWNQYHDYSKDFNFMQMILKNRPRDYIGRMFKKRFNDGVIYDGRVLSYNKQTKWWRVQYSDGQIEEFDEEDMKNHVINKQTEGIEETPPQSGGHTISIPADSPVKETATTQERNDVSVRKENEEDDGIQPLHSDSLTCPNNSMMMNTKEEQIFKCKS